MESLVGYGLRSGLGLGNTLNLDEAGVGVGVALAPLVAHMPSPAIILSTRFFRIVYIDALCWYFVGGCVCEVVIKWWCRDCGGERCAVHITTVGVRYAGD